jgi:hypothetical protein
MKNLGSFCCTCLLAFSASATAEETPSTESQLAQVGSIASDLTVFVPALALQDGLDLEPTEDADARTDIDPFLEYLTTLEGKNLWAGFEYYGVGENGEALWKLKSYGANTYNNWWAGNERGEEQGTHGSGLGDCPAGQVVVGVRYYECGYADWTDKINNDWVDGIGVHCQSLSDGSELFFNWSEDEADLDEQGTHGLGMGDCPSGEVVVGLQYFEGGDDDWVDGIGVHCQSLAADAADVTESFHNWYVDGERGDEQGTHGVGMGDCPAGSKVVGVQYFEGGNDDWVDGIGVHCQ